MEIDKFFFSFQSWKQNNVDRQMMLNWQNVFQYSFQTCKNTERGLSITSIMEVIMLPHSSSGQGVQFVSRALLARYWDCAAGWCCSSKIKLVSPADHLRKTDSENNPKVKLECKMIIYAETELHWDKMYFLNLLFWPSTPTQSFSWGLCVCVSICVQWMKPEG